MDEKLVGLHGIASNMVALAQSFGVTPRPHVQLKVKRLHPAAKLPTRAHETDAGLDFYAVERLEVGFADLVVKIGTGLAAEVPPGWVLYLTGRSGLSSRGLVVLPGVVDESYRGEIAVMVLNLTESGHVFNAGDRIAQGLLLPRPSVEIIETDELTPTQRGAGGFGSTGA